MTLKEAMPYLNSGNEFNETVTMENNYNPPLNPNFDNPKINIPTGDIPPTPTEENTEFGEYSPDEWLELHKEKMKNAPTQTPLEWGKPATGWDTGLIGMVGKTIERKKRSDAIRDWNTKMEAEKRQILKAKKDQTENEAQRKALQEFAKETAEDVAEGRFDLKDPNSIETIKSGLASYMSLYGGNSKEDLINRSKFVNDYAPEIHKYLQGKMGQSYTVRATKEAAKSNASGKYRSDLMDELVKKEQLLNKYVSDNGGRFEIGSYFALPENEREAYLARSFSGADRNEINQYVLPLLLDIDHVRGLLGRERKYTPSGQKYNVRNLGERAHGKVGETITNFQGQEGTIMEDGTVDWK